LKRAEFAEYKGQGHTPKVYSVLVYFPSLERGAHILDDVLYTNRADAEKRFTEVKAELAARGLSWYLGQKATAINNPTVSIYVTWDWQDTNGAREIARTAPCTIDDIMQRWTTYTPWS